MFAYLEFEKNQGSWYTNANETNKAFEFYSPPIIFVMQQHSCQTDCTKLLYGHGHRHLSTSCITRLKGVCPVEHWHKWKTYLYLSRYLAQFLFIWQTCVNTTRTTHATQLVPKNNGTYQLYFIEPLLAIYLAPLKTQQIQIWFICLDAIPCYIINCNKNPQA